MQILYVADRLNHSEEQLFLSENDAVMNEINADRKIAPTGDVDRDIVAIMVPHNQGAVDMAKNELKYGHSEQRRRLKIVATQQKEIRLIRDAVSEGPSSAPQLALISGSVARGGMRISQ